jgi:hypothetical protein
MPPHIQVSENYENIYLKILTKENKSGMLTLRRRKKES